MSARQVVPGLLLIIAAVILLALVSFNVPLLKSIHFLEARFQEYTLRLGTMGYCLETNGNMTCQGPQIGYDFDLNKVMNLQNMPFNIPRAVSKYLTYVLVIHIISLGFAVLALLTGVLELIPGCIVFCFPTCLAGIAGGLALIVFIFDVAIFYIARARINDVGGASASIGQATWMVLAAWLCCSFAGCAYGVGRACCWDSGRERGGTRHHHHKRSRREKAAEDAAYRRDEALRMQAIRDDMMRKEAQLAAAHQQQDLPNFAAYERQPLTTDVDDKYYYDEGGDGVRALPSDGYGQAGPAAQAYGVPGVGVGYGRRTGNVQRQPSTGSTMTYAGAAGLGAGGAGVEVPGRYDGYAAYQVPQTQAYTSTGASTGYERPTLTQPYTTTTTTTTYDPYAFNGGGDQAYNYDNTTQGYAAAQTQDGSNPYAQAATAAVAGTAAAGAARHLGSSERERDRAGQRTSFHSSDNYHDPHARVAAVDYGASADGYDAIGRAATAPSDPRYRTPPPPPPPKTPRTAQAAQVAYAERAARTSHERERERAERAQDRARHAQAHQSLDSAYTTNTAYTVPASSYAPAPSAAAPHTSHARRSTRPGAAPGPTISVPQPQPSGQFYVANRSASPASDYDSGYTYSNDVERPPSYGHVAHGHSGGYPSEKR